MRFLKVPNFPLPSGVKKGVQRHRAVVYHQPTPDILSSSFILKLQGTTPVHEIVCKLIDQMILSP